MKSLLKWENWYLSNKVTFLSILFSSFDFHEKKICGWICHIIIFFSMHSMHFNVFIKKLSLINLLNLWWPDVHIKNCKCGIWTLQYFGVVVIFKTKWDHQKENLIFSFAPSCHFLWTKFWKAKMPVTSYQSLWVAIHAYKYCFFGLIL